MSKNYVKKHKGHEVQNPTKKDIESILNYDNETGVFNWINSSGGVASGSVAGGYGDQGYILIGFGGKKHRAHRLAWTLISGEPPKGEVDHINGTRDDNRAINLRDVSATENQRNRRIQSNNSSGVNGVYWSSQRGKWHARIKIGGKYKSLGFYNSLESASQARAAANKEFGFHESHGTEKHVSQLLKGGEL